jgi:hypothetical protein
MSLKLVFLDVDGVLHSNDPSQESQAEWVEGVSGLFKFGGQLERLIKSTGALIVVMSSWRRDPPMLQHLTTELSKHWGLEILDKTPVLATGAQRHLEIYQWFNDNPAYKDAMWVALDDCCLDLPPANFVQCEDPDKGLTEVLADEAIARLNSALATPIYFVQDVGGSSSDDDNRALASAPVRPFANAPVLIECEELVHFGCTVGCWDRQPRFSELTPEYCKCPL